MIKRILVCCSKARLLKVQHKPKPERYELVAARQDKKMFKKEIYSTLLEIILSLTDENNEEGG